MLGKMLHTNCIRFQCKTCCSVLYKMLRVLIRYFVLIFFVNNVYASNLTIKIEKESAKRSHCSIKRPCSITIEKHSEGYKAGVLYDGIITEYGVVKYLPSKIYYFYNLKGEFISRRIAP